MESSLWDPPSIFFSLFIFLGADAFDWDFTKGKQQQAGRSNKREILHRHTPPAGN